MKKFVFAGVLTMQLLTVAALGAEEIILKGENAKKLIASLSAAGVESRESQGFTRLDLTDLKCEYAPHSFIWAQCSGYDGQAAKEVASFEATANEVIGTFINLGFKYTQSHDVLGMELEVKSVSCVSTENLQKEIESTCTVVQ